MSGAFWKELTLPRMERFYRAIAVTAIYFVFCGFTVPIYAGYASFLALLGFLLNAALFALGYAVQAGLCRLLHYKRRSATALDSYRDYYDLRVALLLWGVALPIGFGARALTDHLLRLDLMHMPGSYYDPRSLTPWIFFAVAVAAVMVGGACWFFPHERLLSTGSAMLCLTLLLISFFLYVLSGAAVTAPIVLCLFFYALCALIVINQTHIGYVSRGMTVTFMTVCSRQYNLLLSLSLIVVFAVATGLIYTVFVGASVLGRMLLFTFLNAGSANSDHQYRDPDEIAADYALFVFQDRTPEQSQNFYLFLVFLLLLLGGLLYLIFRRVDWVRRTVAWIRQWILDLFEMLFGYSEKVGPRRETPRYGNFKDTERKISRAAIRAYETTSEVLYYADFCKSLEACASREEKIRFAYVTLVGLLRKQPLRIRPCHTPRQIADRLSASDYAAIGALTPAYEKAAYWPDHRMTEPEAENVLAELCAMVRTFMV